jgi:DNA polymerase III subunit gamma/tau
VSLDTKYRPLRYSDVLGQDATIQVCKQIVVEGKGFHQSYVFAGAHGGGKTTCGRILARAMLCERPQEGEPCDECESCIAVLNDASENFIEVDAATNSGKDHVKRITEEAQFGSFSGKRKIYLFDECHELSKSAMDAMLKPLEDNIRGSEEKQLICIFCTTEPKKMRPAIMSRCAPAFKIRLNTPEEIAKRLGFILDSEKLEYDPAVLPVVAEVCECHIRDSIKAVEGVSMLGKVDRENVERYLHLDANVLYLDLLESLGMDLPRALMTVEKLIERVSPATCYERMADISMMAYRLSYVGHASVPSYWDRDRVKRVGDLHKEFLVLFAQSFAERPAYATMSMLLCDVGALHQKRAGIRVVASSTVDVAIPATRPAPTPLAITTPVSVPEPVSEPEPSTAPEPETPFVERAVAVEEEAAPEPTASEPAPPEPEPAPEPIESLPKPEPQKSTESPNEPAQAGSMAKKDPFVNSMGVHINPQAQQMSRGNSSRQDDAFGTMPIASFTKVLHRRVIELTQEKSISGRQARRDDVGSA